MTTYAVVLRSASGAERTVYVQARNDQGASNAALRQAREGEIMRRLGEEVRPARVVADLGVGVEPVERGDYVLLTDADAVELREVLRKRKSPLAKRLRDELRRVLR